MWEGESTDPRFSVKYRTTDFPPANFLAKTDYPLGLQNHLNKREGAFWMQAVTPQSKTDILYTYNLNPKQKAYKLKKAILIQDTVTGENVTLTLSVQYDKETGNMVNALIKYNGNKIDDLGFAFSLAKNLNFELQQLTKMMSGEVEIKLN